MKFTRTVLIVEDDPLFQVTFSQVFAHIGGEWKIHLAQDGSSALAALKEKGCNFELALIDIGLPDMSGIDVVAAAHKQFSNLPILVATMFTTEEQFLSAIRAGARGYLIKDDSELSLKKSIESILHGQLPVSPAMARYLFRLAGSPAIGQGTNNIKLSPRELELLHYISKGNSYADCASAMNISLSTVQTHIRNTYRKLEVSNQRQAINKAIGSAVFSH
jgi:two-component system nitrate/nitrite response regulator NarL